MKTAGIIGGSGFIGSYITKKFLNEHFRVRVSSTNIEDEDRYNHLLTLNNADNLEVAALDLQKIETLNPFIDGCNIIIHAGTPFQLDVKDPTAELFEPTVKGTENFLHSAKEIKGLEKVIIIASAAAYNTSFPLNPEGYESGYVFTESDTPYYSEEDHPYSQAKYFANQEVEKFIEENENLPFEIVTLAPSWVIGKALSDRQDSTSQGLQHLFKNNIAPNPFVETLFETDTAFSTVDVRDVAGAVYKTAITPGLHGKNYFIANETYKVSDISRMLNNQPPTSDPAYTYSNALAEKDLDLNFISAEKTLNNWG